MSAQRYPFLVNETPYCLWDNDLGKTDLEFLDMIDPLYFEHIAKIHGDLLNDEEQAQYAATALRMSYTQSLETLFALICAVVQANQGIAGWMLEYTNRKLENLVARIHTGQPIKSRLKGRINWEQLAEMLTPIHSGDAQRDIRIKARFGELWRRLANDFLDTAMKVEYNSFKHGLRVSMHGTYFAIGSGEPPSLGASPEALHVLVDSKFGSSYFMGEKLDAQDGTNIRLVRHSVNWNPHKFAVLLQLVSISINNIVNTLRCAHGVPSSEAHCLFPIEDSTFDLPWELEQPGITALSWDKGLDMEAVVLMTREDILASYGAKST